MSKVAKIGDEFKFLRRKCKLEVVGLWIQPGNYIQQMLKAYGEQIGAYVGKTSTTTRRQLNPDGRQVRSLA